MIKVPAYFSGFSSRTDGSAGMRFATQEMSPEDFAQLQKHLNLFGWLIFKEGEVQQEDVPIEDAEEGGKSPSKRLRAVLFILWKQGDKKLDFESFYRQRMDQLIEVIKNKLD